MGRRVRRDVRLDRSDLERRAPQAGSIALRHRCLYLGRLPVHLIHRLCQSRRHPRACSDGQLCPHSVLPFIAAELAGGATAAAAFGWLLGSGKARTAGIAERSDPISTGWVTRLDRRYGRAAGRLDSAGTSRDRSARDVAWTPCQRAARSIAFARASPAGATAPRDALRARARAPHRPPASRRQAPAGRPREGARPPPGRQRSRRSGSAPARPPRARRSRSCARCRGSVSRNRSAAR